MGSVLANFSLCFAPKGELTLGRQRVLSPRSYPCQEGTRGTRQTTAWWDPHTHGAGDVFSCAGLITSASTSPTWDGQCEEGRQRDRGSGKV